MRKNITYKYQGYTLIELLIVLVIIGILAGFAYPSYVKYVSRSNRADALATLTQTQLTMERCYAQNFSYSAACSSKPSFPFSSPLNYYTISVANLGTSTYTLTATAKGNQTRDTTCATMSINQANVKIGLDKGGASQTSCWNP